MKRKDEFENGCDSRNKTCPPIVHDLPQDMFCKTCPPEDVFAHKTGPPIRHVLMLDMWSSKK